jgi:hypothetical protein
MDDSHDSNNSDSVDANIQKHGIAKPAQGITEQHEPKDRGQVAIANKHRSLLSRFLRALVRPRRWRNRRRHAQEQPVNGVERATLAVAILVFIVTSIQAIIYYEQLERMEDSVNQTEREVTLNLGQLAVANRNAESAKESADVARDTLTTVQRPYIFFGPHAEVHSETVPISDQNPTGVEWVFKIPIRNNGVTPTSQMFDHSSSYSSGYAEGPIGKNFDYRDIGDQQHFNVLLAPNDVVFSQPLRIKARQIAAVLRRLAMKEYWRGTHLYFYGWVRYRDMLPDTPEHITKYCFELTAFNYNPFEPAIPKNDVTELSVCHAHNCMDEACKKENGPPFDIDWRLK